MQICSLTFFSFTAAVLLLYYLLPRSGQNYLLLFASYIFYITISWKFAVVLLMMTASNFILGKKIGIENTAKKWLSIGIGCNLMVLMVFKFSNFYVVEVEELFSQLGFQQNTASLKVILPVGLSFYTLHAISYLVDLYRKQLPVCSNPVDFGLYLAYFPKLTAGPIERARTFLPKLTRHRVIDNQLIAESMTLLVIGLFRKMVIADTLIGAIPVKIFESPLEYSAIELAAWISAFAFGLYNDFCGYTNIVRGISGFFGIELSRNFINPFFSRNLSEFWNRWHITLSLWLRDYIYFPISRALVRRNPSKHNPLNIILPPMATMLASGLWHGPNLNYLSWGAVMGLFLTAERFISLDKPGAALDRQPLWRQISGFVSVFILGIVALVVFLMGFKTGFQFFQAMIINSQWVLPESRVFIVIIPAILIDIIQHTKKNELIFLEWPLPARSVLLGLMALSIYLFSQTDIPEPFVYQGF
jgi:D-alanyl-lipoteichoic acid acyltransferase DltB (MBOAT superfamily)